MTYAYAIEHITVKDMGKWAEYRRRLPETLEPWDAELIFKAKLSTVQTDAPEASVVIRFPTARDMNNWHASQEYQDLIPLQNEAADAEFLGLAE